jgi:hypothetical protein
MARNNLLNTVKNQSKRKEEKEYFKAPAFSSAGGRRSGIFCFTKNHSY